jgi:hypothetical protein
MTTLTRKERQVIIDKWLNDVEDENYVVVPMKTKKGKFIVRPRKQRSTYSAGINASSNTKTPYVVSSPLSLREDDSEDENKDEHEDEDDNKQDFVQSAPHKKSTSNVARKEFVRTVETRSADVRSARAVYSRNKDMEIRSARIEDSLPEILEHLKMLGEDIKRRQAESQRKQQKKDIKHEIKYIQSKAAQTHSVAQALRTDEYDTHEVNVTRIEDSQALPPRYVRRKINLAAILHL